MAACLKCVETLRHTAESETGPPGRQRNGTARLCCASRCGQFSYLHEWFQTLSMHAAGYPGSLLKHRSLGLPRRLSFKKSEWGQRISFLRKVQADAADLGPHFENKHCSIEIVSENIVKLWKIVKILKGQWKNAEDQHSNWSQIPRTDRSTENSQRQGFSPGGTEAVICPH